MYMYKYMSVLFILEVFYLKFSKHSTTSSACVRTSRYKLLEELQL